MTHSLNNSNKIIVYRRFGVADIIIKVKMTVLAAV